MKIKKLEIKGFKSFSDRTVLQFKPGITAVVGPNGCGKSNVFEAIRWAMGEQRARILRGKKMEDVIFNGSDSRKPLGMAEVRLVLSNTDGLGPPAMADYDEIMITRRLFRDGDSQYEINNITCRLADIVDFFLDTGVGKNSYAIIEQGKVDMVVASKPADRRVLIEEAAGINRYKARREAALKRLEQTRNNLLRISDLVSEVKRQSASLKRQASKAEQYRALSSRLRELDIGLHALRCTASQTRFRELTAELEQHRGTLVEAEAGNAAVQAELEEKRLSALEIERELKEVLERKHRSDVEISTLRARIESDENSLANLNDGRETLVKRKEAIEHELSAAAERHNELEIRSGHARTQREEVEAELRTAQERARTSDKELDEQRRVRDSLKDDIFSNLQQSAQAGNRRESAARRISELETRVKAQEKETDELAGARADATARLSGLQEKLDGIRETDGRQQARKHELEEQRQAFMTEAAGLRGRSADLEKVMARSEAQLDSLNQRLAGFQDYGEGVQYLMSHPESAAKLVAPLADLVDVSPEFEAALTAALGDRLSHLVVSSTRDGADLVRRLQEAQQGRSTCIPTVPRTEETGKGRGILQPGLKPLKDVVNFKEGLEPLRDFLLDRYVLVEDVGAAVQIWEENGAAVDLVTEDGTIISRYGEVSGGSARRDTDSVFQVRRNAEQMQAGIAEAQAQLDQLNQRLEAADAHIAALTAELQSLERSQHEQAVTRAGIEMELQQGRKDLERLNKRADVLGHETRTLTAEKQRLITEMNEAEQAQSRLETERKELETRKDEAALRIEELSGIAEEEHQRSGEIRARLAQLDERSGSLLRECAAADRQVTQLERQIAETGTELDHRTEQIRALTERLNQARHKQQALEAQQSELSQQHRTLASRSEDMALALKELEKRVAQLDRVIKDEREVSHSLEMEAVRIEQALRDMVEKITDRYGVDPREVTPPAEEPGDEEIAALRTKLQALGEVNLAAIHESRLTEERLTFLLEQEEDLNNAVESLYATIDKINRTTRERFRAAFDSINTQFQEIFPFLFRGGEARLELTDEQDLLETGVEIMARPPGKRIRNMDLLSGGEKALTAVALIFSIFLTRPSPFCLLDEVDAPLDDTNLARFNELLRRLGNQTQFLVITHNKRSMESADALYGVTMDEPGASRVVSVEFVQ